MVDDEGPNPEVAEGFYSDRFLASITCAPAWTPIPLAQLPATVLDFVRQLWPVLPRSDQLNLAIAIHELRAGQAVVIGAAADGSPAVSPRAGAVGASHEDLGDGEQVELYHGCAPSALLGILTRGLSKTFGAGAEAIRRRYGSVPPSPTCRPPKPRRRHIPCICTFQCGVRAW